MTSTSGSKSIRRGKERSFVVKKSRVAAFVEANEFPLSYEKFCDLYGTEIIEANVTPLVMASKEQVAELARLIEFVKIDPELVEKWLKKAGAEDFDEMSSDQINKCIAFVKAKLKDAEGEVAA
jgi:hypothetical protein